MAWTRVGLYHYADRKLPWLVRWYGEIEPSTGNPKRYSKSFRIKRQAEDFRAEKTHEFKEGIRRDRPEEVTLGRLCEDFLKTWNPAAKEATMDLYKSTVERLLKHFGARCLIGSIGPRQADSFLASQTHYINDPTKELSDWTRVQITRHCVTILGVAVRWQWLALNPFAGVKMPKPGTKRWHRLAVPEYRKLLEVAPTLRWKVFYALVFTSGARFGELFNLTWADIDFERGRMIIQNREGSDIMPPFSIKDKDERFVQLPTETLDFLTQYQQEALEGVPYILLTKERYERVLKKWHKYCKEGRSWRNRYMVNNVGRDFKSHAKRAGLRFNASFTIHTFRKTCAQNWADHLPANVVKFYLGHSNISTTNKFYSIVDESHTSRTTKVMDELLKGKTENHLDTGWTLAPESKQKTGAKKKAAEAASIVNPSQKSTSEASDKWAVLDLNQ
jgi:integrase